MRQHQIGPEFGKRHFVSTDIWTVPIEAIKFTDLEHLALTGVEEGPRLELKRALPTSDGHPDRWMRDQSGIGRVARDDIAKEAVAFANAYGEIILIGMEETDDNPKRAKQIFSPQIPHVVDCAEQLLRTLRAVIDPPLPMLEVRGVSSDALGNGVIFVRVGSSPMAPHGIGRPSVAYVRRGANLEPLTMRDLQSMFFESRTRLERIETRRAEQSSIAQELWSKRLAGLLPTRTGAPFAPSGQGMLFRCTLTPLISMEIDNFPDRFLNSK